MVRFRGAHVKNNEKSQGPYALVASPQLPYNSEMEWSEMESERVKVFMLTSLLIWLDLQLPMDSFHRLEDSAHFPSCGG